jgi:glycosyltransferase involved in cell wall biosynthesis
MDDTHSLICLTPTRNEAWIINKFLAAARCWADHVIVADQGSSDGTLELLRQTTGVQTIVNDSPNYDEAYRQRLLIGNARKILGKRILLALDADEALSSNVLSSKDRERMAKAAPGTVLRFKWVNILPGFERAWIPPEPTAFGFVDDGSEHDGSRIHSRRIPWPKGAPVIDLEDIVVLHFQYVAWERMVSKHRWYQAWEYAKHQEKGPLAIFREYHHMYGSWDKNEIHPVRPEWLAGYDRAGIDFHSLKTELVTWWDEEVFQMLSEHSPAHFRKIAIWDKDWNAISDEVGKKNGGLSDPRSAGEKIAHMLLKRSQNHRSNLVVRAFERCLRMSGW